MKSRAWIVCSAAIVTLAAGLGGGVAQAAHGPRGGQQLQQALLLGADTAWAWTQSETAPVSGGGAQGIELTTDGGVTWSDVTPPGLAVQGGKHWISGFFALDTDDARVTYGGVGSEAKQTIIATTDAGRTWSALGPEPQWCELDFVSIRNGWCPAIGAAAGSATVTLYRTTDGARSWRAVSRTPIGRDTPGTLPFSGDKVIDFTTRCTGWAMFGTPVGTASLFETEDAGRTWVARHVTVTPRSRNPYGGAFAGAPVLDGRYGAVGYNIDGRAGPRTIVYVTTDRGRDWHPVVPPGPAEPWLVDTLTARRWRLLNGNRILETDNMGRTWHTITANHRFPALFCAYNSVPAALFASGAIGWVVQQRPAGTNSSGGRLTAAASGTRCRSPLPE